MSLEALKSGRIQYASKDSVMHRGVYNTEYLVRAFTKSRRGPCGVLLTLLTLLMA